MQRDSKRGLTEDELRLWFANTRDVKPIQIESKEITPKGNAGVQEISRPLPGEETLRFQVSVPPPQPLQVKNRRALRNISIDARLDLHGLTHAEAWSHLLGFIQRCFHQGRKTAIIITGKGSISSTHTLRTQVPRWLEEEPFISMISGMQQAKPQDGGAGAFYLYIKQKR